MVFKLEEQFLLMTMKRIRCIGWETHKKIVYSATSSTQDLWWRLNQVQLLTNENGKSCESLFVVLLGYIHWIFQPRLNSWVVDLVNTVIRDFLRHPNFLSWHNFNVWGKFERFVYFWHELELENQQCVTSCSLGSNFFFNSSIRIPHFKSKKDFCAGDF